MKIIIALVIFCLVLFIYLHLHYQLKTSNDLEVYHIENPSKEKLEEICDLRQPVTFEYNMEDENLKIDYIRKNYGGFDIKIRDNTDLENNIIPIPINISQKLFNSDENGKYYSENNQDFLEETGLIKTLQHNDIFLRPPMVSNCHYDILCGSKLSSTPFRYELNYRTFFLVKNGCIKIKLSPPKSIKYLYCEKDYSNFEFKSKINPWNIDEKYKQDFIKIKCLDIELHAGSIIYIPAYWWYSIQFEESSQLYSFKYRTYMNNIAILPHILISLLQMQNTKLNVVKNLVNKKEVRIQENCNEEFIYKDNNNENEKLNDNNN